MSMGSRRLRVWGAIRLVTPRRIMLQRWPVVARALRTMLTVTEAQAIVLRHTQPFAPRPTQLTPAEVGLNIQPRARELQRGATVLAAGAVLRPQEFGLLAIVGRTEVSAYPPPRVAILATGDEIVEPSSAPGESQIRNSNGPMLLAQ